MVSGRHQTTLKNAINCTGIGLHSGTRVNMALQPAAPGSGIVFERADLAGQDRDVLVPARWDQVCDTKLGTKLANEDGVTMATVEHLMAAFAGCGVDNVRVVIDGPEVPIMDGSSAPFVFLIECAGIVEQAARRRMLRIRKEVRIDEPGKSAALYPDDRFSIRFEIDFDSPAIQMTEGAFDLVDGTFKREIAAARTFGFERDVETMHRHGLARGGSLDNAVVVGHDHRILNAGGLRFDDEFVRHKVLDAVGDLYLAGAPILGAFEGVRSGHSLNNRLLRAVMTDPSAWDLVDAMPRPTALPTANVAVAASA
jgi:UDP-3-O-[3-hydroxymyristoyl] N-acetylglucosamine deacetylase